MRNRHLSLFGVLAIGVLVSCGGGGGEQSSSESSSSGSSAENQNTGAGVEAVADPEAKSESKGVGKFSTVQTGPIDEALAEKGEAIFTSKCASCHRLTEEKLVGPGLKGVTERRTPEWILNMITNPENMTKEDPVAKALFEKHLIQMTFQNVSDDEARQLLEFLRKNDAK